MYREEMKAVGLNPDCNIEHDLKKKVMSIDMTTIPTYQRVEMRMITF
jgi:hypothetical protein